jgi:hypothetical protein
MIRGACLCGAVRYEVEPPFRWFAFCHCSMCRTHHGALYGASVGVERSRFRWLGGKAAVRAHWSSRSFERTFCRHCGSKVPAASHIADVVLVPAGTLDAELDAKPRAHIFVGSKSPLTELSDALPKFEAYPPGVDLPTSDPPASAAGGRLHGSCLCREVAYVLDVAPVRIAHCHCSLCRRSRGGPFATTALLEADELRWTRGEDAIATYRMPPPRSYGTDFCASCGSLLPTVVPEAGVAVIQVGAVEGLRRPLPGVHIHVASKARWDEITDDLPRFDEMPPEELMSELF